MDRDDARFIASALTSRITGDREALDRLLVTSLVRMTAAAARVRALAAGWSPALLAAAELEAIAKSGGAVCDDPPPDIQIFVDKLLEIAGEPIPRNRHERRAAAKLHLPRRDRLIGGAKMVLH